MKKSAKCIALAVTLICTYIPAEAEDNCSVCYHDGEKYSHGAVVGNRQCYCETSGAFVIPHACKWGPKS